MSPRGRPPGSRNKQQRRGDARAGLVIYLTPEEKAVITRAAKNEGLPTSIFIRNAALLRAERPTSEPEPATGF